MLGIEGTAARLYFEAFPSLLTGADGLPGPAEAVVAAISSLNGGTLAIERLQDDRCMHVPYDS